MGRRKSTKRPYNEPHPELDVDRLRGGSVPRIEPGPAGEPYNVATSRLTESTFICPACGQVIPAQTAHVVAWATGHLFGEGVAVEERRHWHTACWERFGRTRG